MRPAHSILSAKLRPIWPNDSLSEFTENFDPISSRNIPIRICGFYPFGLIPISVKLNFNLWSEITTPQGFFSSLYALRVFGEPVLTVSLPSTMQIDGGGSQLSLIYLNCFAANRSRLKACYRRRDKGGSPVKISDTYQSI